MQMRTLIWFIAAVAAVLIVALVVIAHTDEGLSGLLRHIPGH